MGNYPGMCHERDPLLSAVGELQEASGNISRDNIHDNIFERLVTFRRRLVSRAVTRQNSGS